MRVQIGKPDGAADALEVLRDRAREIAAVEVVGARARDAFETGCEPRLHEKRPDLRDLAALKKSLREAGLRFELAGFFRRGRRPG